ncbi:MAG: hypothetical protein J2P38_00140 [Candidatus Dormibacteraeota bacterium]|nr:hypothetical protein [Candidatus Dormibacteraeota bacterium]
MGSGQQRFRVTHPFHPLSGREYELARYGHTWGEHRVFFREPGEIRVRSLPASWTDILEPDPFVAMAACRSPLHLDDLVLLVALLQDLEAGRR